jgi:branched-chain amino acid transport system permease protein
MSMSARDVIQRIRATRFTAWLIVIAVAYAFPLVLGVGSLTLAQYDLIIAFLVAAIGLNIAMGVAGQQLIGITAVFAVGAYAAALFARSFPAVIGLVPMMALGAVAGALGGLIIGLPALRVKGFYLALVSIYASLCVVAVGVWWTWDGGEEGVPLFAIARFKPELGGYELYAILVGLLLVVVIFSALTIRSPIGRRFAALRTSNELASSVGISGYRTKLLAIEIGSVLAGVGGALYTYSQQFFSPDVISTNLTILLLAAVIIGGEGTIAGPILGGVLVLGLNQFLTGFQDVTPVIFGGILLLCAVLLPHGIVDQLNQLARHGLRRGLRGRTLGERTAEVPLTEIPAAALDLVLPPDGFTDQPEHGDERLSVAGVRRAFGGVIAVNGVDLEVTPGTIHGLIGSNGSGKTTLLNLISRFYRLDSGSIQIGQRLISKKSADYVVLQGVARTFQSPKLLVEASALENVMVGADLRNHAWGPEQVLRLPRGRRYNTEADLRSRAALSVVGLDHVIDTPVAALPHGTRRLVEVARVLAMGPRFALLDEPAAGLSTAELERLVTVIKLMADRGIGVLLIEHNVPVVLDIATDVTVLHQGVCLFRGTPEELRDNDDVARAFLGVDEPADLDDGARPEMERT